MNQDDRTIYFPYAGDDLVAAATKAKKIADDTGQPVRFKFNGIELDVAHSMTVNGIVAAYIALATAANPAFSVNGTLIVETPHGNIRQAAGVALAVKRRTSQTPVALRFNGVEVAVVSNDTVEVIEARHADAYAAAEIQPANPAQQRLEDFESDMKKIEAKWKDKHDGLVEILQFVREGVMAGDADRLNQFLTLYHETLMQCWRDVTRTVPR